MKKDCIFKKLQNFITERNDILPSRVKPESRLKRDLGMDSLDIVEAVLEIEKEFQCSIPDEELETLKTVNDIVDAVYNQKTSL